MIRKLGTIAFVLSLVGFSVLGYLEVSARMSQKQMKSTWDDLQEREPKGTNKKHRQREDTKKETVREERSARKERNSFRQLKVEKRGPEKNQLGVLVIPKIGVEQVVLYDSTVKNLKLGPSLMKQTAYPGHRGNAVIAGHRTSYGFPFKRIDELKKGDKIIFKNGSGRVVYSVKRKFRVKPNDTSVLKQTKGARLTLLSCDPPLSSTYRLIVTADRLSQPTRANTK